MAALQPGRGPARLGGMMRRVLLAVASALALALLALVSAPPPSAACSCALMSLAEVGAQPNTAVFAGVTGEPVGNRLQMRVQEWFHGEDPAAVVEIEGWFDGNGASCGIDAPRAGTELLLATFRDDAGRYAMHLCTLHAPLDSREGQALLAEARAVFGSPATPEGGGPVETPAAEGLPAWVPLAGIVTVLAVLSAAGFILAERGRPARRG